MFGGRFLNARYVNVSWRLLNLAVNSEIDDILSFRSYFQSKGGVGYFLDTRYIYIQYLPSVFPCFLIDLHSDPTV